MVVKLLEINNRSYYFWDDTINIKDFSPGLSKLDKKSSSVGIDIYYIGYITKKTIYSINSVNPLYLIIKTIDGYVEEKDGNRYLNIALTNNNDEVMMKKFNEVWKGIKDQILKINGSVEEYDIYYKKIKFYSNVTLPLNTVLKFHALTVVIRCIIEKMVNIIQKFT